MRRFVFAFLVLALLPSWVSAGGGRFLPEERELRRIENERYVPLVHCCRHKAVEYAAFLARKGYIVRIVAGLAYARQGAYKAPCAGGCLHAWVEVRNPENGHEHMLDPTWRGSDSDEEGYELEFYVTLRVPWYIFSPDVSPDDIKERRNVKSVHWENLPRSEKKELRACGDCQWTEK